MMIFFSFLLSHRILPLHTMEYILGFGGQLADLLTQLIQEMKKEELLGTIQRTMSPMNSVNFVLKSISIRAIFYRTSTSTSWRIVILIFDGT